MRLICPFCACQYDTNDGYMVGMPCPYVFLDDTKCHGYLEVRLRETFHYEDRL